MPSSLPALFDSPPPVAAPFAEEDLARVFEARTLRRGRDLVLAGAVRIARGPGRVEARVTDLGRELAVMVAPVSRGRRVAFDRTCGCGRPGCAHMAAAALAALDAWPEWRRTSLLDLMGESSAPPPTAAPVPAAARMPVRPSALAPVPRPVLHSVLWRLEPGKDDVALYVAASLVPTSGPGAGEGEPASPRDVLERAAPDAEEDRNIARLLGGGGVVRTPVLKVRRDAVDRILRALLATGRLRWHRGGRLVEGPPRALRAFRDQKTGKLRPSGLAPGSVLVRGLAYWCIDAKAGQICPIELQVVDLPKPKAPVVAASPVPVPAHLRPDPPAAAPRAGGGDAARIVERTPSVIARLGRVVSPSDGLVDVLRLSFDYGEDGTPVEIDADDQRQFARAEDVDGSPLFIRRDRDLEQEALQRLATLGFAQARIDPPKGSLNPRGARVHWLTGRDVAERWQDFMAVQAPALRADGWVVEIGADFGARVVEPGGEVAVAVRDAGDGWFDLDVGVEIDGERRPLLPILAGLVERGGMSAARVIDGRAHVVLEDGSVLALPADRVERLLSVVEAMIDQARRVDNTLRVPLAEADALVDIDDLIARRPDSARQITAFLDRMRADEPLPEVPVPSRFRAELRDYQRAGLAWLQGLRAGGVAGILADDMGLGKTAQTLAHIAVEHDAGRLDEPCLIVVPTSLVPNWVAEAKRFTPHLSVLVLHGLERHGLHGETDRADIVVTTYGVVARDLEVMKRRTWHMIVLDEAQAIKNPDSKATRAVCDLKARHRLCLSGTPVENNLGELWSQFAFLMPGLLGDRKDFQKRFRNPIEKRGDATRASLLLRRIRPFLLRRTKADVAKELPPKTEVIRRIELDSAQRDLYEAIRLSVHEKVRAAIAAAGIQRSAITVIDALLKLRQVCCDPRLVKVANDVTDSAKLQSLIDMVEEMVPEGRRILVFSQFTSMLDLIKAELDRVGIAYVELTGRTRDRAEPVARFQRGEVPVFLISLKAGGRGLNLTAADTVIHYDPWWNPAAEDQATDRAYRIGQDKPVFVYKLIATDTVEERILDLQRRKGNLTAATIEGTGTLTGALEDGDIDYLFQKAEGEG
ncbi:DEAD/DEAH box helicase [Azospirillum sp. RWY-5-1]|uniref:DEAD/DEAH box helicase n=1 Tax=Azospirillum oleiclasticum TaxID=2735135 RepID=A0ABX2T423_9PROT|nr:DEAD/DEAH box helicase [Azospirillum oleiclasticum]NYZ19018.1 DEAD/DEAH box helicase [Azospirillum oleiclasticum]